MRPGGAQLAQAWGYFMEPPASNRLGLAEPVSRTEGNKPLPSVVLGDARQEYIAAARHGRAGRDIQARYAGRIDALVQQLAETARVHSGAAMSICALGGYGRRSLCLHSDIDILILFEDAIGPSEERFVGALLQPLWDLGLTVGQHVRDLTDFPEPATLDLGNAEFLLALLDVRFIAGDERLFQRLDGWVRGLGADNRRRLLDALLQLVDERHAPFNETIYQLEPDIKSAPGGLRDIAAARHIRLLKPGGADTELIAPRGSSRTPRISSSASVRSCTSTAAVT